METDGQMTPPTRTKIATDTDNSDLAVTATCRQCVDEDMEAYAMTPAAMVIMIIAVFGVS